MRSKWQNESHLGCLGGIRRERCIRPTIVSKADKPPSSDLNNS